MNRLILALIILGSSPVVWAQTDTATEEPPFEAAEALSVTDVTIPFSSIASGTLVLDAVVSDTGKVRTVEVRRGIVSLTEAAVSAVQGWTFAPATFAGKAVASRVPVAVTVRPALDVVQPMPLPALKPQTEAAIQAQFQPAEVLHAAFPSYSGENAVYPVTVVLEVALSARGKVKEVKVLRDVPGATDDAEAVVGDWRFMPATWNGHPVPSNIVLAFVFRPPVYINPQ